MKKELLEIEISISPGKTSFDKHEIASGKLQTISILKPNMGTDIKSGPLST